MVPGNRMRSKGRELKHKKFHFSMWKNCFTLRMAEHWIRLPRDIMESPSLETLKTHVDVFLCHLLKVTLPCQGGWTGSSEIHFSPNDCVDLTQLVSSLCSARFLAEESWGRAAARA